jgi:hypothetical protein
VIVAFIALNNWTSALKEAFHGVLITNYGVIMAAKTKSKMVNEKLTINANFKLPESNSEFRELIKKVTQEELKKLSKEELKKIYERAKEAYPSTMKKISRPERENLYFIQEQLFGKLDPKLISSLENIGETLVKNPASRKKSIKYNLPGSGAVIVKQWKGKKLEIKIIDSGFEYQGKKYKSLSNLAKDISGYVVSGPVFFELRKPKEKIIS